jgi:N-acetylmuramoyl-L-alanine amidase
MLAGGTVGAQASKARVRYVTVDGQRYLVMEDVAAYYGMRFSHAPSSKGVTLQSRYSRLDFALESRESTLNSISVHLGLPVRAWRGGAVISDTDFQLTLDPILRRQCLTQGRVRRVMLDPGHGGKDPGTRGDKLRQEEKTVMLALAKQLQAELVRRGYEVALTRTADQTLDLVRRPALAAQWHADVFVSLHANYAGTASVRGIETFRLTPRGSVSSYGNSPNSVTRPGNACDRRNTRLAYEVQKALIGATGAPDRGVRQANFQVLREATCPAVLVEAGFMSNSQDERALGSAAYRTKIVGGIADGIDRYRQALAPQP